VSQQLEIFLARIYVDAEARRRFLEDPRREAKLAGLTPAECDSVANIDRPGLEFAARSFALKQERRQKPFHRQGTWGYLFRFRKPRWM
jgi:hypothetical protein